MGPEQLHSFIFRSHSPAETEDLGSAIAGWLEVGDIVLVSGELGSGKTCLVRSMIAGLGYRGRVRSPSFNIVFLYNTQKPAVHIDLFRVDAGELYELGITEILDNRSHIVFIEWAEKLGGVTAWTLWVEMEMVGDGGRHIVMRMGKSIADFRIADFAERTRFLRLEPGS